MYRQLVEKIWHDKMHPITNISCLVYFFMLPFITVAQQDLKFSHIGTREGLSHSWVKCIEKDQQGFLWVGTINGLNRYDGKSFKVYMPNSESPFSLSDNFIQVIKADSRNNIWIGTYSGGINRFNPLNEEFKPFRHLQDDPNSISNDRIYSIFEDSQRRLWVGTANGLDQYDYEKEQFSHFEFSKDYSQSINDLVSSIFEDDLHNFWIGTNQGLIYLDFSNETLTRFVHTSNQNSLSHDYVTSIYQDEQDQLWIGTWGGGLNFFKPATKSFISYTYDRENPASLRHNSILTLTGDQKGHVYIGTEGGGFNVLTLKDMKFQSFLPEVQTINSMKSNSIHSLLYDKQSGITWIGTYHSGLNFFSEWDKPFKHYKLGENELNNSNVLCFTEDKSGQVYIGTDGGGINVLDKKLQQFRYLKHDEKKSSSLLSNAVISLLIDNNENLWVGTFNGGLDFLPKGSTTFQHYISKPDIQNTLSDNDVNDICQTSDGKIWVGTMDGGLNLFDPVTKTFKRYQHNSRVSNSISNNYISLIFEGKNHKLYIQTGVTLDVFDPDTELFSRFDKDYDIELRTPLYSIEDSKGNFWAGTQEHLIHFNTSTKQFMRFTIEDGLPSSNITGIIEDDYNNLWISTMKGLVKFESAVDFPERKLFIVNSEEDGLQANDFKDQACYKGEDGIFYFGGQNGFNSFDPKLIQLNPVPPKVAFTSFKLFNTEVLFGEGKIITQPINEATEIRLMHYHNVFSFEFAALNYWLPKKNKYAYMMQGFDKNWNYVDNQSQATYTNLNPGKYTFKVKASNNDGIWSAYEKTIDIFISPPWWKTNWFQMSLLIIIVLGIVAFIRIRLFQLKQRQKELKKEVELRTREIQDINLILAERNEEIGQKNSSLLDKNDQLTHQNEALEIQAEKIQKLLKEIQELSEMKFRFFTNISHELRTPLTLILGPLEKLMGKTEKRVPKELELMHRNALKLLKLINQLLDFRKIESGNIQLSANKNDIITCVKEVFDTFKFVADKKQIAFELKSNHEHLDLWFDADKMDKIITNLLSNAFKYTEIGGQILVEIVEDKSQNFVEIIISDTGTGIPDNQIGHIFDLYFQATNASNLKQAGTGIGLALIKQYVGLHHGNIEVNSHVNQGTTFQITMPMGNQHLSASEISNEEPKEIIHEDLEIQLSSEFNQLGQIDYPSVDIIDDEKPQLLVVEDNADIREYIKDGLEVFFQIITANNGKEGLEKALACIPEIIVSDVMMPEMNGLIMCQKLKSNEVSSHIPILLLTAYSGEERQWEGFKSGADDYITKPFNLNILQQKLKNITHTRQKLIEKFSKSGDLEVHKLISNEADKTFMDKAMDIINQNLTNSDFNVEEFSDQFNMSRRNLLRKIKSITGQSVNEFIKLIRLKKSISFLKQEDMNISEVAYAVGFSDPKYFSKCFKEHFGKSPSEITHLNDLL